MSEQPPRVGNLAPDFTLAITRGQPETRATVTLGDYRGKWLGLLFYPRDFSLVCPTELTAVSNRYEEFRRHGCELLGVSTDSLTSHEHWLTAPRGQGGLGGLRYPLGADEEGLVCKAYGVYVPYQHVALRGLFFIDPNGVMQYQVVHNLSVGRRSDELLRVLAGLQSGGMCPESWSEGDTPLDPAATIGPGTVLGQYRILESLGGGSFGAVFRAYDTLLQRLVALKVLKPTNPHAITSVLQEARAAAAVTHPHLCIVYSIDNSEGLPLIAMEYLSGQTLSKLLERGPLPPSQVRAIAWQIADGLAAAHAAGVVHGDLKPANIMLTEGGLAKIMDFGLARRELPQEALTETPDQTGPASVQEPPRGISGTPAYMSPEQAKGLRPIPASDVFSFGLVLAEMLTGQRVLNASSLLAVLRQITEVDGHRLAAGQAEPFAGILRRTLVVPVEERTVTMQEIAELLR
jgi:alkyl hydroperoxide reductase subunit AhpC